MNRKKFREISVLISKQKKTKTKRALLHLLINYRTYNSEVYPPAMKKTMIDLLHEKIMFDYAGVYMFKLLFRDEYNQPSFNDTRWRSRAAINDDIPF